MGIRRRLFKLGGPLIKAWTKRYHAKPRMWRYGRHTFMIHPGVFYPNQTFSTGFMLDFMSALDLKGEKVLDIGCGSGAIAVFAAMRGAASTGVDLSDLALENTKANARLNEVEVQVVKSDLLEKVKSQTFDYMFVNPPFYPKHPKTIEEHAWFCGADFDYFSKFFDQIREIGVPPKGLFMILSQDCDLERINHIAGKNGLSMTLKQTMKNAIEENHIFSIIKTENI